MAFEKIAFSGFDWDKGNAEKNLAKHGISRGQKEAQYYEEEFKD